MSRKSLRVESYPVRPAELLLSARLGRHAIMAAAQLGSNATANKSRTMRVGFIGLDQTGEAMASRLIKAGHQLTVYDPAREIPEALASAGWSVANSIQDACRSADAVFTMLPNDEVTEAVILGPGGVIESLPGKAIHIGSSTVSVECSDRIVEAHWDAGKQYVSAPVLVRSEGTEEEQLLVIAAGSEATIIQMEPLLSRIGQLAQLSGWPSDANVIQLGANYMGATLFQFLARHPELCARQHLSQPARPASPLARFLGIETKGVLQ
jgi:3-hydroxyisobutyrate dehydrogenase-like beta-hydroxyacid dehydrogenase